MHYLLHFLQSSQGCLLNFGEMDLDELESQELQWDLTRLTKKSLILLCLFVAHTADCQSSEVGPVKNKKKNNNN